MTQPSDVSDEALKHARKVWQFMHMVVEPEQPADIIFVLGSNDIRVADHAAQLYHQGKGKKLLFSGGFGYLTEGVFRKPEAQLFAEAAIKAGVPKKDILVEPKSTNTGENIAFSRRLLVQHGILSNEDDAIDIIIVQKTYMTRRAYASLRKQWPSSNIVGVSSPDLSLEQYPIEAVISLPDVIHVFVGDFQRIREYPKLGFQIPLDIPEDVLDSWRALVRLGYTDHLIPGAPTD